MDDEQTDADNAHIAATHRGESLLHHVNPRIGLRHADFTALAGFAGRPDFSAGGQRAVEEREQTVPVAL